MTEERRDGDGPEHHGASDVADDEHGPLGKAVDEDAGHQRDEWKGDLLKGRENTHLERSGVQRKHRESRQRQLADRAAELADSLAEPELAKVSAEPKSANVQAHPSKALTGLSAPAGAHARPS